MDSPRGETRRLARLRMARGVLPVCVLSWTVAIGLSSAVLDGIHVLAQTPAPTATVQEAMQQGADAMTAGNFNAAVTAYTTVTEEMPSFAEGHFNLGLAQQQAGQLDDAQASLKKALRLKPDLRGGNLFLGIIAYRQNRYKEAEDDLQRETRVDPHSAKAFMWLGVCHLAQDDPQGAIAPLDKAYALDASDADILYHRGRAYFLVANASYAAMFKLNYDSVRVHQVLAESYAQAYRNQEAILEFELAVKMAPDLPGLHEELADQYWVMGQADKAGDNYREELRIDPYADTSMYKLGSLLVMHQNPSEGVKLLRDALRADPSLSDAHYYLAEGLTSLDQDEDAIHEFELAIAADPANERAMSAYYRLSQLYRDRHDTANAQAAMQNFMRMRAQNKLHQTQVDAQVVRKRTELPVADPEKTAEPDGQAAN
jgi:tetratricopeptide (TPR) repeat protein